jgi:hypothetical protein
MYWVYKCNSKGNDYQRTYGDWAKIFESQEDQPWGSTKIVPELVQAQIGDTVLAYQTNRNELVGVARVVAWKPHGNSKRLVLRPVRAIGVRVRPLKKANSKVARIPALQPGPIRTLYEISREDADTLLRAAGTHLARGADQSESSAATTVKGAGFGTPEQNKLVERAAVRHVVRDYRSKGWSVSDVSSDNRGYDLICRQSSEELHVEVKGAGGDGQQFIITAKELNAWTTDKRFVLAFVGRALSARPSISVYRGAETKATFSISPLSFMAKRRLSAMSAVASRKKPRLT